MKQETIVGATDRDLLFAILNAVIAIGERLTGDRMIVRIVKENGNPTGESNRANDTSNVKFVTLAEASDEGVQAVCQTHSALCE